MSMPQSFTIIVTSEKGEYAAAVASVLDPSIGIGYCPEIIAVSTLGIQNRKIYSEGMDLGYHINSTIGIYLVDPKVVDLWLALDNDGEELARRWIRQKGPAPKTYYRSWFPDPVVRCEVELPNMYHYDLLGIWIREIDTLMRPWRNKILQAYGESS